MNKPITHQINENIMNLLEQNPKGLKWSELAKKVIETNPNFHPKTVNGLIWKLTEKYPGQVYKPEKGLFRLTKFK